MTELSDPERLALLRRFEPVLHFTGGERFFPMDVERYVAQCSLWVQHPDRPAEQIITEGKLSLQHLPQHRPEAFGTIYFLQFIEPPDLLEMARLSLDEAVRSMRARRREQGFRPGRARLARVGYASRFLDAIFSISLLLRGRVPGDTAAAAALTYRKLQAEQESYRYYGRVEQVNGWWVFQYWYFYPFNNWRSGFDGVNDHEADWEMAAVYCYEEENANPDAPLVERLRPMWLACASHEFHGDDLRRRWDDPEVIKVTGLDGGEHPVIFAAAGSHACYFSAGEYMAEIEVHFLVPVVSWLRQLQAFIKDRLGLRLWQEPERAFDVFRVPFIDYARGDGLKIGTGEEKTWQPYLLDELTGWAAGYRGLWGWYANDPIAGENAPAGPVYNRDGSVRRSWCDPVGWCGLDRVSPPPESLKVLAHQQVQAQARLAELVQLIETKSAQLHQLGVAADALHGYAHLSQEHARQHMQIEKLSVELFNLRQEQDLLKNRSEAYERHAQKLRQGEGSPPRAHLHRPASPSSEVNYPLLGLAEFLAAASIGVLMITTVLLIVFARQYALVSLGLIVGVLVFFEAGFRGRLFRLVNSLTIGLAIFALLVLVYEFFWQIVAFSVLVSGIYLLWENLRELGR